MSYDFMLAYKPSFTLFQRQILKVVEERTLLLCRPQMQQAAGL